MKTKPLIVFLRNYDKDYPYAVRFGDEADIQIVNFIKLVHPDLHEYIELHDKFKFNAVTNLTIEEKESIKSFLNTIELEYEDKTIGRIHLEP